MTPAKEIQAHDEHVQLKTNLRAFHGDYQVQRLYLDRLKAHRDADEIIQGVYWQSGKGCAVGCTLHSDRHASYEDELGLPLELAAIQDQIFEGLEKDKAKDFPINFLRSVNLGSCHARTHIRFFKWLFVNPESILEKPIFDDVINERVVLHDDVRQEIRRAKEREEHHSAEATKHNLAARELVWKIDNLSGWAEEKDWQARNEANSLYNIALVAALMSLLEVNNLRRASLVKRAIDYAATASAWRSKDDINKIYELFAPRLIIMLEEEKKAAA